MKAAMRRDYSTDSVEFHDLYCLGSVTLYAKVILVQLAKQSEWKEVKFVYHETGKLYRA